MRRNKHLYRYWKNAVARLKSLGGEYWHVKDTGSNAYILTNAFDAVKIVFGNVDLVPLDSITTIQDQNGRTFYQWKFEDPEESWERVTTIPCMQCNQETVPERTLRLARENNTYPLDASCTECKSTGWLQPGPATNMEWQMTIRKR